MEALPGIVALKSFEADKSILQAAFQDNLTYLSEAAPKLTEIASELLKPGDHISMVFILNSPMIFFAHPNDYKGIYTPQITCCVLALTDLSLYMNNLGINAATATIGTTELYGFLETHPYMPVNALVYTSYECSPIHYLAAAASGLTNNDSQNIFYL